MVWLNRIQITGFKSIQELDLELRPLNILIGANGSGKSNFISAFKLLNRLVNQRLQVFVAQAGGADTLLYFGRKVTKAMEIKLHFGSYTYTSRFVPTSENALIFEEEKFSFYDKSKLGESSLIPTKGQAETGLHRQQVMHDAIRQELLDRLLKITVYHFHDTSESATVKQTHDIDDNLFLRPDASNLAAYLYLLKETQPDYYYRIVRIVQLIAPFFDDFVLLPTPLNTNKIMLRWREKGSDLAFNASLLSDGMLRFMCLTTLLSQPNLPPIVLIDEPELGLHPYAITLLASMLDKASSESQVIVSTQSVTLVDHFLAQDIIVVNKAHGKSEFQRQDEPSLADWLKDYTLGELWEKNIIGGRP